MNLKNIKITFLSLLALSLANMMQAAEYTYSPSQASTISGKTFAAGDVITLENGNWENVTLRLRGTGTADNQITFKARTAGKVIFTGSSTLNIDGKYIKVSGLLFEGNSTVGKTSVITFSKNSADCRLTNSAIRNYNPADESVWAATDNKWVSMYGIHNRVDHCYFEGKGNIGTLLVVWLVSGQTAKHKIDQNHFYKRVSLLDENGKERNGQEIIRVGDSNTSMTDAQCTIERNFFEECNGEVELISNKSCGNTYRYNVFYNNNATLTLRHGNNCKVYGNYFLGNNLSKAGGVRIIGEDHKVYNNYFQDIQGSGYRSALCIVNGKTNSALNEYFQVKNAFVAFNTFYNCKNVFTIGYDGGKELAPVGCTIAHNVVFAASNSQTGVNIANAQSEITWKNNLMYQGRFTYFSPSATEFARTTTNLNFQASNPAYGIYRPTSQSVITTSYKTSDNPEITTDIEGRPRPSQRMIGAFEITGGGTIEMPTPQNVGCTFINKSTSRIAVAAINNTDSFIDKVYVNGREVHVILQSEIKSIKVYNLQRQIVYMPDFANDAKLLHFQLPNNLEGIYLLAFDNGYTTQTQKIVLK